MTGSPIAEYGHGQRRPDASMSLLNNLTAHALDEDYAAAAARRGSAAPPPGRRQLAGLAAAAVAFGLLLAVAAVQTDRSRPAAEQERAELIERIRTQSETVEGLREQVQQLTTEVSTLEARASTTAQQLRQVERQIEVLGIAAGTEAVTGPGIQVTVDDAESSEHGGQVLDTDLQLLVNGLWLAGAEAVSINGQRITTRSSIRTANRAITVNFRSLRRPYVVAAIGDPASLEARFIETPAGQAWLDWEQNFGVRFDTVTVESVTVPARNLGPLRYAEPAEEVRQ